MSDASARFGTSGIGPLSIGDLQVGDEGDANRRLNSDPVPDLPGAVRAFYRVLRPGGAAIVVFSHPCFPQGRRSDAPDGGTSYRWDFPYFEHRRCVDPPWGHFRCDFVWFHRPLSDYWRAFRSVGFDVVDFDEPRLEAEREHSITPRGRAW